MKHQHRLVLQLLWGFVVANYVAQILYYLHEYYLPHRTPPNPSSTFLLTLTFTWVIVGYTGVARGRRARGMCSCLPSSPASWLLPGELARPESERLSAVHASANLRPHPLHCVWNRQSHCCGGRLFP